MSGLVLKKTEEGERAWRGAELSSAERRILSFLREPLVEVAARTLVMNDPFYEVFLKKGWIEWSQNQVTEDVTEVSALDRLRQKGAPAPTGAHQAQKLDDFAFLFQKNENQEQPETPSSVTSVSSSSSSVKPPEFIASLVSDKKDKSDKTDKTEDKLSVLFSRQGPSLASSGSQRSKIEDFAQKHGFMVPTEEEIESSARRFMEQFGLSTEPGKSENP